MLVLSCPGGDVGWGVGVGLVAGGCRSATGPVGVVHHGGNWNYWRHKKKKLKSVGGLGLAKYLISKGA